MEVLDGFGKLLVVDLTRSYSCIASGSILAVHKDIIISSVQFGLLTSGVEEESNWAWAQNVK